MGDESAAKGQGNTEAVPAGSPLYPKGRETEGEARVTRTRISEEAPCRVGAETFGWIPACH